MVRRARIVYQEARFSKGLGKQNVCVLIEVWAPVEVHHWGFSNEGIQLRNGDAVKYSGTFVPS